jgi:hypothetical protein
MVLAIFAIVSEVINKFNKKVPKTTIYHVAVWKLIKKYVETDSILNVKKTGKHLDGYRRDQKSHA